MSTKKLDAVVISLFDHAPKLRETWNVKSGQDPLSAELTEIRIKAGLTQREVAAAADIDTNTVMRLESGLVEDPSIDVLQRYLDACGSGVVRSMLKI